MLPRVISAAFVAALAVAVFGLAGSSPRALAQAGPAVPIPGPCIQIYPPPPGCGGGATVTTDQAQYAVGSPIQICYTVPGPGPVTIIDQQPGGLTHTLLSVYDDGTGWCFGGTVTPPAGTECLFMSFGGASSSGSQAQTCFQVSGNAGGCSLPAQTVYTTSGSGGSVLLNSGQCLSLVLGSGYYWTVNVDDSSVLSCSGGVFAGGQSATCTAAGPGTTTLRATGNPTCYPQCLRPSILFQLSVTVVQ